MEDKAAVLYIDDEFFNLSAFEILFRSKFTIFATHNLSKAIEIVKKNDVDIVIADQKMPVMTGVELLKKIIEINNSTLRIIHSGYIDDPEIKKAVEDGIAHFILDKPLNKTTMLKMIDDYRSKKNP